MLAALKFDFVAGLCSISADQRVEVVGSEQLGAQTFAG